MVKSGYYRRLYRRNKKAYYGLGAARSYQRGVIGEARAIRSRVSRGYFRKSQNSHYIRRSTSTIFGISSITAPSLNSFGSFEFKLSDLPAFSELQALFDNWQLLCVVIKLTPVRVQMKVEEAVPTTEVPRFYWCYDYDDSTPPTSIDQIQQYATCKEVPMTKPVKIKIYPKLSMTAYNTGVTSAYVRPTPKLQKMMLCDCAYPNVPHYGIKYGIAVPNSASLGIYSYRVDAVYYLKMTGLI